MLTSATSAGGDTTIASTLNSTPSTSFRVEFFSSTARDATGFGQGELFIGAATVTTDGSGNASFTFNTGSATPTGRFITATATNNVTDDTSEFSYAAEVNGAEAFQFSSTVFFVRENAGGATITVTRTNGTVGGTTVNSRSLTTGFPSSTPRAITVIWSTGSSTPQSTGKGSASRKGIEHGCSSKWFGK